MNKIFAGTIGAVAALTACGSDEQVVFVFFSPAKASTFDHGQTGTSGGITVAQNGDVVTVTGSEATFESAGVTHGR
jgi:hypothetical protein